MRRRQWIVGAVLMALSVAGLLLLLEAGVRLVAPQDPGFFDSEKFLRTESLPGAPPTLAPGASGSYTGVPVAINSLGLREDEPAVPKPVGSFRVLVVGDSVTFGFGVRKEECWTARVEALLNDGASGGRRWELINAGVPAAGLPTYETLIRSLVSKLEPDLLIVALSLNDILDYGRAGAPPVDGRAGPAEAISRATSAGFADRINRALLRHSHLYLLAYVRAKSLAYRTGLLDINERYRGHFLAIQPPSGDQARAWESSTGRLGRIVEAARVLGVPLALVVFPLEPQIDRESLDMYRERVGLEIGAEALEGIPQAKLSEMAAGHGVPLLDLLPVFRAAGARDLYLRNRSISIDWIHLSPAGHALASEAIAEWLIGLPAAALPGGRS